MKPSSATDSSMARCDSSEVISRSKDKEMGPWVSGGGMWQLARSLSSPTR